MKLSKLFITFSLLLSPFSLLNATIYIDGKNYPIDTIESYKVGPGSVYSRYEVQMSSSRKVKLYMLETDLTNPYVKVEQRNAGGIVGTNERVDAAHAKLDAPGHRDVGCVNCNFFWTSSSSSIGLAGNPTGGTATDGVLSTQPDEWNMSAQNIGVKGWDDMGYVVIDRDGKCHIDNYEWDGRVWINDNFYYLRDCNRQRTNPNTDEIALFNFRLGSAPTRTFSGTEVIFSVDQWRINGDIHCTVVSTNNHGGTVIPDQQGALQCRGTGAEFVSGLTVGSTFTINLGIYSSNDDSRPDIMQMSMGNALCMANDTLTIRNTNEAYNTQVYARTGMATNDDGTKLWQMVMQTPGMSTTEMCYIFKAAGATRAVGCDGGGSAQMGIFGQVVNTTTEATPRALNTSLWIFSTAPDRTEPGQLYYADPTPLSMPAYASYTPQIRAYTAEGNFLTHDTKQYTLSCEPAELGTISADGLTFTANPVSMSGKLIASYGEARCEKQIIVANGEVRFRLDSVLIGNRDYTVEVEAVAGNLILPVGAKALTWESKDESRCTVNDEGILHAVANGRTQVVGSLAEFSDTLLVITEMATNSQLSFLNSPLSIDTSFSSTRNITIVMPLDMQLWGNPDSVLVVVNTNAPLQSLEMTARAANGIENKKSVTGKPSVNEDYTYAFPTDELMGTTDQSIYPIRLESAKFTLKDPKKNTNYSLTIKDIILCYRDWAEVTADPSLTLPSKGRECKIMVNGQVYIINNNHIYDVHGHEMK